MKQSLFVKMLLVLALMLLAVAPSMAQDDVLEIYITGLTEDTMTWFREVAFPAFEAEHPGVKLEILTGGWGDFDATVAGWITTGDGPEIVYLGSEYAPPLATCWPMSPRCWKAGTASNSTCPPHSIPSLGMAHCVACRC